MKNATKTLAFHLKKVKEEVDKLTDSGYEVQISLSTNGIEGCSFTCTKRIHVIKKPPIETRYAIE